MKCATVLIAALAICSLAPAHAMSLAQIEELLGWCNATVPVPDHSVNDFLGPLNIAVIPDAEIAYFRFGNNATSRPAIILVVGYNSVMSSWPLDFLHALAENQEVIIFDNRGQGLSTDTSPDVELTVFSMSNDTKNFAEALELDTPPNLMGVSMGGMITLTTAALHGESFNRFIPISASAGGPKSKEMSSTIMYDITHIANLTLETAINLYFPSQYPQAFEALCQYTLEGFSRLAIPANLTTSARQIQAITAYYEDSTVYDLLPETEAHILLFSGSEDPVVPAQNAKLAAKQLPHPWLVVFSDAAHAAYVQHWKTVIDIVEVFLTEDAEDA